MKENINWSYIITKIYLYGIEGLFFYTLTQLKLTDRIPVKILNLLRKAEKEKIKVSLLLDSELVKILQVFKKNNVNFFLLKGWLLTEITKIDRILRIGKNADIDFLVQGKDFSLIKIVMEKNGYRPYADLTIKLSKVVTYFIRLCFKRHQKEILRGMRFYNSSSNLAIDFYSEEEIFSVGRWLCKIDSEKEWEYLWKNARRIEIGNNNVQILPLEELILNISVHFITQHGLSELYSLWDISEIIHQFNKEIDWKRLIEISKKYRSKNILYFTLSLAKNIFNIPISDIFLNHLRPGFLKRWFFKILIGKQIPFNFFPRRIFPVVGEELRFLLSTCFMADSFKDFVKINVLLSLFIINSLLNLKSAGNSER
ncbi:MAG: nucleotidyltransferase family protein [bacterium]|nr:nucleotidyltransferase family protein [bacterium]